MKNQKLPFSIVFILFLVPLFFPEHIEASSKIKVKVDILNVREGAGISNPIIAQIKQGDTYDIEEENQNWYKIKLKDNSYGWVASWLVDRTDASTKAIQSNVKQLHVRTGPGTSYKSLGMINPNNAYKFLSQEGDWIKIHYNGQEGWVASWLVSTKQTSSEQVAESATIEASILNVRNKPSTSSKILGKLSKGQIVSIIDVQDGWYKIQFNKSEGWIAGDYVKKRVAHHFEIVTVNNLNVRKTPSLQGSLVGKLAKGNRVKVIEEKNKWKKILMDDGIEGWVAGWYLAKINNQPTTTTQDTIQNVPVVTILHNGTNIRSRSSTNSKVVYRANKDEKLQVVNQTGDWYEILLPNGNTAFVAGWIVSVSGNLPKVTKTISTNKSLQGKTIVLDPGHGGKDSGTIGANGSLEKNLTLSTSKLIAKLLTQAGAKVVLTHKDDRYVSLPYRVSMSHYHQADAFISVHYNSSFDSRAHGITTFYYSKRKDKPLAINIHEKLIKSTGLRDRYVQYGNYQVLRTNKNAAVLLELGFLSHPNEEKQVRTAQYQQTAAYAIYEGLVQYFK
jgi:N-acetylmuramoyl-L-alanine amidase